MAPRKKRKRKVAKVPALNLGSTRAMRVMVDHTKDPVFKLKPNDLVWYTPLNLDGTKEEKELHLVLSHTYDRDPDRISSHPTMKLLDGELYSDVLYCFGKDACIIQHLTDTHKIELSVVNGKNSFKLIKNRQKK